MVDDHRRHRRPSLEIFLWRHPLGPDPLAGRLSLQGFELLMVFFSFVVAFAPSFFVFEISPIVGTRNLRNILLGRHHRPRVEERFFLFVDVEGSTSVAERIGPAAVHRFLDGVFRLASDPIGDHGGQIYQYVDDEMVVTWTAAEARVAARPIACFFAIVAALQKRWLRSSSGSLAWRRA